MSSDFCIVPMDATHKSLASVFSCGNDILDQHLNGYWALDPNYGKTFIFLDGCGRNIIGFFNISTGYISREENGVLIRDGGSIHINDFALDERYQGIEVGLTTDGQQIKVSDVLFRLCLEHIRHLRDSEIGFTFITLESTAQGYNLYLRNGFEPLEKDQNFAHEPKAGECIQMYYAIDAEY